MIERWQVFKFAYNIDIGAITIKTNNMTTETKPNDVITGFNGLTKREYFAAMAMQGLIGIRDINDPYADYDEIAVEASEYADALINELNASR